VFKKIHILLLVLLFGFFLSMQSCKKEEIDEGKDYESLKSEITEKYKDHGKFTWDQYEAILDEISKDKYVVLPMYLMKDYHDSTKVVICMRHDVDVHIFKALDMAEMEYLHGIRSTYYMLSTAYYYGSFKDNKMVRNKCMGEAYLKINFFGHEIGIHNDLMAVMILRKTDPMTYNREEIDYYSSLGIPIYGTAAHGSYIAQQTVANFQIFSDFAKKSNVEYKGKSYPIGQYSLSDFGFTYEAYFTDYNKYFSDAGGDWNFDNNYDGMLEALKNSVPGDRIQILTHPVWWGKE